MRTAAGLRIGFLAFVLLLSGFGWSPAHGFGPGDSVPIIIDDGGASGGAPEESTQEVTPLVCAGSPGFPAGPITRFLAPIEPWTLAGLGWEVEAIGDDGSPLCSTNNPPRTTCDPQGPRPFLHAGVDAAPAPDRSVRASAAGRVVAALQSLAMVTGLGTEARGGVVVLEHDPDGDAATQQDRVLTVYAHVDPLVAACDVVEQGQVIARTTAGPGAHLHFAVQRTPFVPGDPDVFRELLPPAGTTGCLPCSARPLPLPVFPGRWDDPDRVLRGPAQWAGLYRSVREDPGDILEIPGGYVVAGATYATNIGNTGADDIWVLNLDPEGRILSQSAYGGPGSERAVRLAPAADGGFVLLASSYQGALERQSPMLLKFRDPGQDLQWQKSYATVGLEQVYDVRATADGGYVLAGATDYSLHTYASRAAVLKVDADGIVQWARSFRIAPVGSPATSARSIVQVDDGGYVVIGEVRIGTGLVQSDLLVFRLDASGNLMWASSFDGGRFDEAGQVERAPDGGFVIAAGAGGVHLWLLKLLPDGRRDWERFYVSLFNRDAGTRIAPDSNDGFVVAGRINHHERGFLDSDAWILKLDAAGEIVRQRSFDGRGRNDGTTGLRATRDGGFVLTGGGLGRGLLVAKTDSDLEVSSGCGNTTDGYRVTWDSAVVSLSLQQTDLAVTATPIELSMVPTTGRGHACAGGFYGPPPLIESASVVLYEEHAQCDVTEMMLDILCSQIGLTDVTTLGPILIDGTYSVLDLQARVIDADSTADQNDVTAVQVELVDSPDSFGPVLDLLDDGSTTAFVQQQFLPDIGEDCFEDPVQGWCTCRGAFYEWYSHDSAGGDSMYSHAPALVTEFSSPLDRFLMDCVMASRGRAIGFHPDPAREREAVLRATDRQGNVTIWPEPTRFTVAPSTAACTGDECLCCAMFSYNAQVECVGLPGLISPYFPNGLCIDLLGPANTP